MVKNKGGGNRGKKVARKLMNNNNHNKKLRISKCEDELYAKVVNLFGGRNMQVLCIDGKNRHCIIRQKFCGRSKRDNFIKSGVWVLIGLREYSTVPKDEKKKNGNVKLEVCDLLEVYKDSEIEELKETVDCDFSMFMSEEEQIINNDIKFVTEEDIELEEQLESENYQKLVATNTTEIDIDDI